MKNKRLTMTNKQILKIWEYINKFNEQNAPKPGTRSCTQIFGWSKYLHKKQNGAMYSITFKENFHGKEKISNLEYISLEQMLTYLKFHTSY